MARISLHAGASVISSGLALMGAVVAHAQPVLPPSFVVENAVPGVHFDLPTCLAFLPDGRILVGEKAGRVWVVKNGIRHPTPLWQNTREVETNGDCGLMSIAVDPDFATNRNVYFLYTVDPDSNGVDTDPYSFGRLTRYRVSTIDSNTVESASRTVLIGVSWSSGPLVGAASHTVGSLRWGEDGSLLVSIGDGASGVDDGGLYPGAFTSGRASLYEDIGAFRAQYTGSLCGKILRIHPQTGRGYSSNPFYQNGNPGSVRSRVWAYGLRNPFRMCVRPGSGDPDPDTGDPGSLFIGDVGWTQWEEIDRALGSENFGWPCFESSLEQPDYQVAEPSHHGCSTIGTSQNPSEHAPPLIAWHHSDSTRALPHEEGLVGNSSIVGAFYTGARYPPIFQNALFFCDFGLNWMKVATFDANDQLIDVSDFAAEMGGPVDFAADPIWGDLHYVSLQSGQLRRIRYAGAGGNDPVAAAGGSPLAGGTPLMVNFNGSSSFSPIGRPLSFAWSFGDGSGSPDAKPSHTYGAPGNYEVVLTVTDDLGGVGRDTIHVVAVEDATFPSAAILDDFNRPNGPIGSSWIDDVAELVIADQQVTQTGGFSSPVWDAPFGPEQEAYMTLSTLTPGAPHHTLMLKIQGNGPSSAHLQVRYHNDQISVATYAPGQGWVFRGAIVPWTFDPGDRFGVRSYSNGVVEVYENDTVIGTVSAGDWPFASSGGRTGFVLQDATSTLIDDFGGGDVPFSTNLPPLATILAPGDSTSFAASDTVWFVGQGVDDRDPAEFLAYVWRVDTHHNNHVHPGTFESTNPTDFLIGEEHDDGTGVWMRAWLFVTDTQGASDTARIEIFPEVDLEPDDLHTNPAQVVENTTAEYGFWLRNHGRMMAPRSHWTMRLGDMVLAEGDTVVPARDSVYVSVLLPPFADPGAHDIRLAADTTQRVVETDEANNGRTSKLVILSGWIDPEAPSFVTGPTVEPHGVHAFFSWSTDERAHGMICFGTTPMLGDSVEVPGDTTAHWVQLDSLTPDSWYWFRVRTIDAASNWRESPLDSFLTHVGPLAADAAPVVEFRLSAAYPNPTSGAVRFSAELPRPAVVRLAVYDLQGRLVWEDPERDTSPGRWTLAWPGVREDGTRARPGLYLAQIQLGDRVYRRRIALVR